MRLDKLPPDPTPEEMKILSLSHAMIYAKLKDPTDKFIVAYVFDMGYSREECAFALGVHYKTVWARINKIRETLGETYLGKNSQKSKETE